MSNPFKVIRTWKPGDTRELSERALKQVRIDGRFDSYAQLYEIDGARWKVAGKVSQASGETLYTLVCVNERE
jgi:hypothetical protein